MEDKYTQLRELTQHMFDVAKDIDSSGGIIECSEGIALRLGHLMDCLGTKDESPETLIYEEWGKRGFPTYGMELLLFAMECRGVIETANSITKLTDGPMMKGDTVYDGRLYRTTLIPREWSSLGKFLLNLIRDRDIEFDRRALGTASETGAWKGGMDKVLIRKVISSPECKDRLSDDDKYAVIEYVLLRGIQPKGRECVLRDFVINMMRRSGYRLSMERLESLRHALHAALGSTPIPYQIEGLINSIPIQECESI